MRGRGALGLSPLRDLRALSAGDWIATGLDPALALGPAAAVAALSGRTVRIRCRHEGASPVLVVEAVGMETRRYRLTPHAAEPGTDDLIRLPAATRALQIEPGSERFRLDAVAVKPVGRAAAGLFRARKIIERLPAQERRPLRLLRRALGLLRTVPPGEILRRLTRAAATAAPPALYADWIAAVEVPSLPSAETMRRLVEALPDRPTFSVLMAAGAGDGERVGASLASLQAQIYPDWELCLATQAPSPSADEPRLRPCIPDGQGEAAALQACLAAARGTHIAVLEPGAVLAPPALLAFARRLAAEPDLDGLYADEDRLGPDGARTDPYFKPDWSPETLEAGFYLGRPTFYRTERVRAVGGFRPECAGALDYDLALRLAENFARIGHIAQVLCHRPAGAALDDAAALRALEARAARTGGTGEARRLAEGSYVLRRAQTARPLVSIVIPTAGRDSLIGQSRVNLLDNCLASIRTRTRYDAIEIVVVEHGVLPEPAKAAMTRHGARGVVYADPAFHFAAKMNLGARTASGEVLVFLNDDIEVITPDWIEAMLALLAIPGVGVVGPKLVFEDGSLQHVGVVFGEGFPNHVRRGFPGDDAGDHGSSLANRNYLAVTGACMMVRRADFEAVQGFDETYPVNYNDIDLCLRLRERSLRVVYCAEGRLHHYESRNRIPVVDPSEQARFRRRWGAQVARDPYYPAVFGVRPPAFRLDAERFPQAARGMVEAWR